MKNLLIGLMLLASVPLFAHTILGQDFHGLPAYCKNNTHQSDKLQNLGPVVAVGASVSSGMLAVSFPLLIASQMCLRKGAGFESLYIIFRKKSNFSFLKKNYIEKRPKIVLALDHLHHSSKNRQFNAATREYIDKEIAMLTLDCKHPSIDCSPEGDFHFVREENYKPMVFLGDIYAFYAKDCSVEYGEEASIYDDENNDNIHIHGPKGCLDDYDKINEYLWQQAEKIPNLTIFPINDFYRNLHKGQPFAYDVNGQAGYFYSHDLFWDGYHPWSKPGAQVFANLVIVKLNELINNGMIKSSISIPYIDINDFSLDLSQ